MSMFRSWIPPAGIHRSTHELPLYHSPSTSPRGRTLSPNEHTGRASSSLSPYRSDSPVINRGKIGESIYASTLRLQHARETPAELLVVERQATELQERLQDLVDAQAQALLAVNGPPGIAAREQNPRLADFPDYLDDDGDSSSLTETAWSTPTSRSPAGRERRLRPQNASRKPRSLHTIRHDIYKTMLRLSRSKFQEHELLTPQLSSHASNLHRIDTWNRQKSRIARTASELQSSSDAQRAQELGEEVDRVDREIEELQARLNQLKSRRVQMDDEHQTLLNRIEAQQAKFRREEHNVDEEVREFLAREPETTAEGPSAKGGKGRLGWRTRKEANNTEGPGAVWEMAPERRTLEMAKDYWEWRLEGSERRVKDAEREEDALKEGARVWRQVVEKVNDFEKSLRHSLSSIAASKSGAETGDTAEAAQSIRNAMDDVAAYLEEQLELSIQNGWNLLIACIGAELDAFTQAKDLLTDTLQTLQQTELSELTASPYNKSARRRSKRSSQVVSEASSATIVPPKQSVASPVQDDSDDPDPDLLISHLDTDPES